MGRHGITLHEVKTAIAHLQGQQIAPTVDNVRQVLGTGSKSTIAKLLREWKIEKEISRPLEAQLPDTLLEMIRGLWKNLQDSANDEIEKQKNSAEEKINDIQLQLSEIANAFSTLQHTHDELHATHLQQTKQLQETENQLSVESKNNLKATEKIDALSVKNSENKAENERLHQLLQHVQTNLAHYQQATQELRQEQMLVLENQRQEYEHKLLTLKQQHDAMHQQFLQAHTHNEQLIKQLSQLEQSNRELAIAIKQTEKECHAVSVQMETTQHAYQESLMATKKLTQENDALKQSTFTVSLENKTLQQTLCDTKTSLDKADQLIYQLRHQMEILSHEKSYIEGQLNQVLATT